MVEMLEIMGRNVMRSCNNLLEGLSVKTIRWTFPFFFHEMGKVNFIEVPLLINLAVQTHRK